MPTPALREGRRSEEAALHLSTIEKRLLRDFSPERIVLFGSQARGEATADSDFDLLIVMPDGSDARSTAHAIRIALADMPVSKDVVVTTPAEIERFGSIIGTVLQEALAEGITLYARS